MSSINMTPKVTLKEFAHAVATVGNKVTMIGEGEMGIGKSAVLGMVATQLPTHTPKYIDCTLLDHGDFALPYVVELNGSKVTKFAPNSRFGLHEGKPVVIMLDEIGKASKSVKNVLLTLLLEHRIGDHHLPEDSRVFCTTNLSAEGVGDLLERHARNRVCVVRIVKSDADTWIEDFALPNDVAPEVVAWVKQYPHCLAEFDDPSQKDNAYINHPNKAGQGACVTPRTLEKASYVVKQRAALGDNVVLAMLAGTIGESAARDMQAFLSCADKLPTWEAITKTPETAKLPDDAVAKCICVYGAITRVEKGTLGAWITYMQRMDKEWQALFAKSVMRSSKQAFCVTNTAFRDWAIKNEWLF